MAENDNQPADRTELDAELRAAVERARSDPHRRRSVSIRGETHARLRAYCEANGVSMSALVEKLIVEAVDPPDVSPPTTDAGESDGGRRV